MTNTYKTLNPLGSNSAKDLYDNASNFDEAMNSPSPSFYDRFNKRRETWAGMEQAFDDFLIASGPVFLGDYDADGPLTITQPNEVFTKDGNYYRAGPALALPYTTVNNWVIDQPKFTLAGDNVIRSDLASTSTSLGVSLVAGASRMVNSVADLLALPQPWSLPVFTLGYSTPGDGGNAGPFYWDALSAETANGGTIFGAGSGRAKLAFSGEINVKIFGAKGDGVTDDTSAIQAAINFANPKGLRVYVPAGLYVISGTGLLVTNTGAGSTGGTQSIAYRTGIRGDGRGASILSWAGGAGQSCLKVISGGVSQVLFENFSLLQPGASKVGTGLLLMQTSHAEFNNIAVEGFETGLKAEDNFTVVFNTCLFAKNIYGATGYFNFVSRPNDFAFNSCNFWLNEIHGLSFKNPTTLLIRGGSFEGNGDNIQFYGALKVDGNPVDGIAGLTVEGVYFENNAGDFDIGIYDSASGGIHNVTGCTFNRVSSTRFTSACIALYKNNLNWRTMIRVHGNGFGGFGTYVPSSTRKYVQVPSPVDTFYVMDVGLNIYGNTAEIPDLPGALSTPRNIGVAVRFNGTTGAIDGISTNVLSVTRNSVGYYTILYAKNLKLAKNSYSVGMAESSVFPELFSESVGSLSFKTRNPAGTLTDFTNLSVLVYGEDGGI